MAQHTITDSQKNQIKGALALMLTVTETIREAGASGVPCGHLYAVLMAQGCSLEQYQMIERTALNTKLVEKRSDCLYWIGPIIGGGAR
ncbi:MAG TPA: hypothetical protein VJQ59_16835 [Candidatus Sulfotelmatobacter sp.]|nr:hypothetical protein [Candidatus Sulfotelmatobacter sp.]